MEIVENFKGGQTILAHIKVGDIFLYDGSYYLKLYDMKFNGDNCFVFNLNTNANMVYDPNTIVQECPKACILDNENTYLSFLNQGDAFVYEGDRYILTCKHDYKFDVFNIDKKLHTILSNKEVIKHELVLFVHY